jgi:surfeit locus 1 family protein
MAESSRDRLEAQYARQGTGPAMNRNLYPRRGVALWGGLLLLMVLPIFIALGSWQWGKAELKLARQAQMDALGRGAPAAMPLQPADPESLRHRRFALQGEYDPARQILIDNRVQQGKAGYHVVTPLRLAGSDVRVLVNRGWIPAPADHSRVPEAPPPAGPVSITGVAMVPADRFFTLGPAPGNAWEPVWQNLDLQRFRAGVPYPLQPVVLQLDPEAPGGYGRDWPHADEGYDRNMGYAVQWFGFALASLGIWVYFLVRRP